MCSSDLVALGTAEAEIDRLKEELEQARAELEQARAERDEAINSALCIEDLEKVKHALGVGMHSKTSSWGYRNRYVCLPDESTDRLVSAGLFELAAGPSELSGGDSVFRSTIAAIDLFCLPKKSEARKDAEWRRNR